MPDSPTPGPFFYEDGITEVERPSQDRFGDDEGPESFFKLLPVLFTYAPIVPTRLPPSVELALRGVDVAFAEASLSDGFEACPHCYTDRDIEYLRTVAPLKMRRRHLSKIAGSLLKTIGSPGDIAYFVPAIVREQLHQRVDCVVVMKLFGRIVASDWTSPRREALRALYEAYFAWKPLESVEFAIAELDEPQNRAWIMEMLERLPLSEPVERSVPGWPD